MPLDIAIEAVLFYKASALRKTDLVTFFGCERATLDEALETLATRLTTGGTRLVMTAEAVQLVTAPELDELIETMRKDELRRDIGKAGAETLAIILYKGTVTRAEIDRIRGVNSAFILRNLLIRGLISKSTDTKHHTFTITPELLNHLGVSNPIELPEYAAVLDRIEKFEQQEQASESTT